MDIEARLNKLDIPDEIKERILPWLNPPFNEKTVAEISQLIEKEDISSLKDRFWIDLEFGTGGLRGIMEAGTNRMNIHTIGRATQGLANYIIKNTADGASRGVVIAYDSRHNSVSFARETSSVLCANGIKVYLYREMRPTPCVSFAVRYLNAQAGIMLTASHNPPQYNGYKVSWDDGCQVVSPHDTGIIDEVMKVDLNKDIKYMSIKEATEKNLLVYLDENVDNAYKKMVLELTLSPEAIKSQAKDFIIVYTPLHGVGSTMIPHLLEQKGFRNIYCVKEQMKPDGDFPTVKSPNPEEAEALTLAIKLAKDKKADIVLATDPDSDRLGIAIPDGRGEFVQLNGNQTLALLVNYVLKLLKDGKRLPEKPAVVKTIVTSDLITDIAKYYGAETYETLTGFKWIYGKQKEFETSSKKPAPEFVVGGEESFGYSVGTKVRDKDGCIASTMLAEYAAYSKNMGSNLLKELENIYRIHSYYLEKNVSYAFPGMEGQIEMSKLMEKLRANPPRIISGYKFMKMQDIERNIETDFTDNSEKESKGLPKSNVLKFLFENGGWIAARPSGTEPKIKFYFSIKEQVEENMDKTREKALGKINVMIKDWFRIAGIE
ncbi:MAG: phospho-sugar mutase [Candidatus Coatesbacteria bacterium]|nr:phospho-sugar mutase [Candidatus Coatesbacteria bacterium]